MVALRITIGAIVLGELLQALRLRRGATRIDLGAEVLFRAVLFAGILLLPAARAFLPEANIPRPWALGAGVVVAWTGLLLRWWSFLTLGRYFTVVLKTAAGQPVVDRGPYKVLRHPSYTGLLLAIAGCGLMLGTWAGTLAAVAVITAALSYRIRIEERALTAALGEPYREFARTRARLVPYVW
ncbi:methyltransferase family protein [Dactylosporangium sp. CS-033363]|uniref:methyltransferase family protein n=1 Tax=Dactylosporangium sp. CS-033363 TaxID=3239935 RepID=UPI003D932A4E